MGHVLSVQLAVGCEGHKLLVRYLVTNWSLNTPTSQIQCGLYLRQQTEWLDKYILCELKQDSTTEYFVFFARSLFLAFSHTLFVRNK